MIYMAISVELKRRKEIRNAQPKAETRQVHPLAWKAKPDPMSES